MRGFACRLLVVALIGGAFAACGRVPLTNDAGTDSAAGDGCTAKSFSCGTDGALYQCDENGTSLGKIEDCQYGCTDDHCRECAANTTFCSTDDLVMCDADGEIVNPQTCANGCQMDRCNTCKPGVAYCDGTNAVTCGLDGMPASMMNCGSAGCIGGVCNSCQPNTTTCQGDTLVVCNANGTVQTATSCALGCATSPNAHCKALVPSYGVSAPAGTIPDLNVTAPATLNLSNCSGTPSSVELTIGTTSMSLVGAPHVARVAQAGPPICVVRFGKITIAAGETLTVVNDSLFGHVLSLQAIGDVQINGAITFTNSAAGPAPGATTSVTNSSPPFTSPGAGGGGGARAGGNGGACNGCPGNTVPPGAGGAAITTVDTALLPGSRGGHVRNGNIAYGFFGAGGGAIHLVSLTRVAIAATGRITLNGLGSVGMPNVRSLGGGAGSGGTLVIEAPALSLSAGALAVANGGGGAGGCPVCVGDFIPTCTNADGEHGQLSATRAAGGSCNGAGNGGYEASGPTNPPANGANSDTGGATASGGGGGGSSGFIILRGRATANVMINGGAVVSPPPTIGAVTAN